ncbi:MULTISPECIES: hypothetical protein [unclassified Microcoleus]|uniref:hypothetical protein n=1 Tax=unclassified Microcoleus TaxID=2642155 RepID=UPI002FD0FDA5
MSQRTAQQQSPARLLALADRNLRKAIMFSYLRNCFGYISAVYPQKLPVKLLTEFLTTFNVQAFCFG